MVGPAGIPSAQVARKAALTRRALASPELVRAYAESGASPWLIGPEDYATYARAQQAALAPLVRASGARAE